MTGAGLHPGSLGRWFEELCRIKHVQLHEITIASCERIASGHLPHEGGVYAFWWTGSVDVLRDQPIRSIALHGPGGRQVHLQFDDEWLGLSTGLPVPLYVGKTAASIAKRIGQHLRLKEKRMLPRGESLNKKERPTTSCQLRGGIDHIFPNERDTRTLLLNSVGLSYVILDGDEHAAHRFYLEDLAIGMMHPPFNVDVEHQVPKENHRLRATIMEQELIQMQTFDIQSHRLLVRDLAKDMPSKEFEAACEPIVRDILMNLEGFRSVDKGPSFNGTPFDYFGFRGGVPYIVELKASRHQFNLPHECWQRSLPLSETGKDSFSSMLDSGSSLRVEQDTKVTPPLSLTAKSGFRNIHLLHWVVSSVGRATDS